MRRFLLAALLVLAAGAAAGAQSPADDMALQREVTSVFITAISRRVVDAR